MTTTDRLTARTVPSTAPLSPATTRTVTTTTARSAPSRHEQPRTPSMLRRLRIELRKTTDTVSGSVLTAVTVAAAPLLVVLWIATEGAEGMTIDVIVGAGSLAAAFLVPILSAIVITSEWGQGSIVTTFAMDHARLRVMAAKILAGLVVTVVVAAACIGSSLLVATLAGIDLGAPRDVVGTCFGVAGALLLYSLLGSAWGALTLNTPFAIVLALAGPQVANTLVTLMSDRLADAGPWFQFSYVIGDLTQGTVESWPKLLSVVALWIVVPLLLGLRRVQRADIA